MSDRIERTANGPGAHATGADIRSLGQRVRVFIGTEPKAEIARKVLEFSIRRRTESEVEFTPMIGSQWEYDTKGFKQGTGFSLRRWMIAEHCKWHGRAIYLDADQLVFSDIWDLFSQPDYNPIPGCPAWMTYQPSKFSKVPHPHSSVMVIDCAAAKNYPYFHINTVFATLRAKPDKKTYSEVMFPNWFKPGQIPNHWNHLNVYEEGKTRLLHYTKEPEQPWYTPDHPFAQKWQMEFQVALSLGYITEIEVVDAVARFGIKEDWRSTNGLHPFYLRYIKSTEARDRAKGLGLTVPKKT